MPKRVQALLELPGRLYYAGELVPCAPAPLVSGCLQFTGLTEAARGVTPIIVHGVVGQVSSIHHLLTMPSGHCQDYEQHSYNMKYYKRPSFSFCHCVCEIVMLF